MPKTNSRGKDTRPIPNWVQIGEMLKYRGWSLTETEKHKITYQRGNEKIMAKKVLGNKWKAEYFVNERLLDSTGIQNETFAKVLTMEMGVSK